MSLTLTFVLGFPGTSILHPGRDRRVSGESPGEAHCVSIFCSACAWSPCVISDFMVALFPQHLTKPCQAWNRGRSNQSLWAVGSACNSPSLMPHSLDLPSHPTPQLLPQLGLIFFRRLSQGPTRTPGSCLCPSLPACCSVSGETFMRLKCALLLLLQLPHGPRASTGCPSSYMCTKVPFWHWRQYLQVSLTHGRGPCLLRPSTI